MRITAKVDYAVRAAVELAAPPPGPMKGDELARRQGIPAKFLENILADLRRAGIVASQRGAEGGYRLARPAADIRVADIIRAVEGPLADVHGSPPEEVDYTGPAVPLRRVWVATPGRAAVDPGGGVGGRHRRGHLPAVGGAGPRRPRRLVPPLRRAYDKGHTA